MSLVGYLLLVVSPAMLLALPRRLAPFAFMMAAVLVPREQQIEIGGLHFTLIRVMIFAGLVRVVIKGETLAGGLKTLDRLMVVWAFYIVGIGFLHTAGDPVARLGLAYDVLGAYFLFRILVLDMDDAVRLFKGICILLAPVAVAMLFEKVTQKNYFSIVFSGPAEAVVRDGHVRAMGPFSHPILAGTIGAVSFPMALYMWRSNKWVAVVGILSSALIVFASGSSGPVMTVVAILWAMSLWRVRSRVRALRWAIVLGLFILNLVMHDPVYYLIARIDITGGSTGWHRAALIQSAIEHLGEWWLIGTDSTRHWMPTGVYSNAADTDITNYYLQMGVWGGIPLMAIFLAVLFSGFGTVGKVLEQQLTFTPRQKFFVWMLGCVLFGHAVSFVSVSYYGEASIVFFFLVLAAITSLSGRPIGPTSPRESQPWYTPQAGAAFEQHV
jgi:hypothetical protein